MWVRTLSIFPVIARNRVRALPEAFRRNQCCAQFQARGRGSEIPGSRATRSASLSRSTSIYALVLCAVPHNERRQEHHFWNEGPRR